MKTLKCDLCDYEQSANTFEEWMEVLKPHYMKSHANEMQKHMHLPKQEQQALMNKWIQENKTRFYTC